MYKIMIADDEGIAIDSLKYIIEKEFSDLCEIETAKTGRQVIEKAEFFRPDIIFMDIQMPGINGIEAMREIRVTNKHVLFIVVSAYDKFDYAKEAINLGVMEYLNKPINKEKIIEVLREAMHKTDASKERRSEDLKVKEKLETVVPIIESGFINHILFQEAYEEDINNYKCLLDMEEDFCIFGVLVFGDGVVDGKMTNAVGSSVKIQNQILEVREIIKSYFPCYMGTVMSNKIPILLPFESREIPYDMRIEMIDRAREMVRKCKSRLDISVRFGIGEVKCIKEGQLSYQGALRALSQAKGSVVHVEDITIENAYEENYPQKTEKEIFANIALGDVEATKDAANSFFAWMIEAYGGYENDIALKTLEFVLRAETVSYEKTGRTYHFQSRQNYLPFVISHMNDMEGLKNWYLEKICLATIEVLNNQKQQDTTIIERAKQFIDENFQKDITLDEVSRFIRISPYYFSKIFKDATGENFIEYVTSLRIEKAKDYLSNSDRSMKEICMEIGYTDPNYFSRIFKKTVGLTPTEYKEKKLG